jgi:hypothetical protein
MRTCTVVLVVLALGCGKKADDHTAAGSGSAVQPEAPKPVEAAPPKDAYKGKNRLVNLYIGKDGKTQPLEVWVRRGFKWGPVKLAEAVPFGKASAWFGVPEHMSPVVLPAGAKPDDKEVSPMAYGKSDEVVTGLLFTSGGVASVTSMYDISKEMTQAPKPSAAGTGGVILFGYALREYEPAMMEKFGGSSFNVGDGTGACRPQRDPAMVNNALGGTSPYSLDLPPGKAKITLHKWPGGSAAERCKSPAVFELEVDVVADKSQWVFLYTPDQGKTLATLALPIGE